MMDRITLLLKGMAMGIAEVIPGVSGGTIAFISGIYEELIDTIKSVLGPDLFKGFKEGGIAGAWKAANGEFVLTLLAGMAIGVIGGVFTVVHLLETHPQLLWAFFFGLILASAIYMARQVQGWRVGEIVALIFGTALAYYITIASPSQGSESLVMVFFAGAIAISALILPGISGSFILLLMGMYLHVTSAIKGLPKGELGSENLLTIAFFCAGAGLGLLGFSKLLRRLLDRHGSATMALLGGFMIGSLRKIWPFKVDLTPEVAEIKLKQMANVWPAPFEASHWTAVALAVGGLAVVLVLDAVSRKLVGRPDGGDPVA